MVAAQVPATSLVYSRRRRSSGSTKGVGVSGSCGATLFARSIESARGFFLDNEMTRRYLMFSRFTQQVVRFLANDDGPTAVEYAVMLALIIVVCIAEIGRAHV